MLILRLVLRLVLADHAANGGDERLELELTSPRQKAGKRNNESRLENRKTLLLKSIRTESC